MVADSFLKLHFIDCLWNFSLGSNVHIHHSFVALISTMNCSDGTKHLSSCFIEVMGFEQYSCYCMRKRVCSCEWSSFISNESAADKSILRKSDEERGFDWEINSVMGKLTTSSCHTTVWEGDLMGNSIQYMTQVNEWWLLLQYANVLFQIYLTWCPKHFNIQVQ